MNEILKRVRDEIIYGLNPSYVEGTGEKEYDEPDKLVVRTGKDVIEFSIKLGSSWYISNGEGIRIFTIGLKQTHAKFYTRSFRYLDVTCDDELLLKWVKSITSNVFNKFNSKISEDLLGTIKACWKKQCNHVTGIINKFPEYHFGMVKTPKIVYHYDDMFDDVFNMEVIELRYPVVSSDQAIKSMIIQVRDNKVKGEVEYYYNLRSLTTDNPPLLIGISKEIKIEKDDFENIIESEFNNYIRESIVPRVPNDIRNRLISAIS